MFGHDDNKDEQDDAMVVSPPADNTSVGPTPPAPVVDTPANDTPTTAPAPDEEVMDAPNPQDADLLNLKKQAIQELSPLVDHLDQTPEEKFSTTMMMIQATDSSSLLKSAYETAQKIEDEKARAQALLDIVNEINYFTQK